MSNPNGKTITTSELRRLRSDNSAFLLLDVLPKAQFDKDHIAGAKNAPFEAIDFLTTVAKVAGNKGKKIVVYCTGVTCNASTNAAKALTVAGYTDVHAYEGGIAEWRSQEKTGKPDATATATDGGAQKGKPAAAEREATAGGRERGEGNP